VPERINVRVARKDPDFQRVKGFIEAAWISFHALSRWSVVVSCILRRKFAAAQSGLRPRSFGEDARLPSRLLLQTHRGLHSAPPILSLNQ
jgi:hypothetical protein